MDFTLPEELVQLREAVARFAAAEIAPHAQEWDRNHGYSEALIPKLGEQGFMGIRVPEAYGGCESGFLAFAIILEEIARHDGGVALAVEAHNGLCCEHILLAGTDEQKKQFLPSLVMGEQIGSWCLSEPGSGTDAAAMKTRARRDADDWILDGSKQFVTNGKRAGTFVVLAVTASKVTTTASGKSGISAFIVERDTPGLTVGPPEHKLGMRSSDTVAVNFENVRLPASQLLGERDHAFIDVKTVLEHGRVMISALSLGLARGALEDSLRYAHERKTFGKSIAEHQLVQGKLADMATQIEAARALVERGCCRLDAGEPIPYGAAVAKLFCSEMATRVCLDAIQVHGGYGYLCDYNVERYLRDAKLCEIGEGTSEILRVLIARGLTKKYGLGSVPKEREAVS